jgi:hypothetical protein
MKQLLVILLLVCSNFVKADAWDNMTELQANHVVKFLHKNPFIIDYCDCCGNGVEVYLIKVESSQVVECSWDKKQFSVLTKGKRIAKFQWTNIGLDDYHTDLHEEEVEYTIFMNYTFGFDKHMKWAVPLFKLINYHQEDPICIGATNYPNPADAGVKIKNQDYIDWYNVHVKKN